MGFEIQRYAIIDNAMKNKTTSPRMSINKQIDLELADIQELEHSNPAEYYTKVLAIVAELVMTKKKHFSVIIKRSNILSAFLDKHKTKTTGNNSEEIYSLLYPNAPTVCPVGNSYKFKDIDIGYSFCGTASQCECARKQVAVTAAESHSLRTLEQIEESNQKRATTISKNNPGVTNNGQLPKSLAKHRAVYDDVDKVDKINASIAQTKASRYNNPNYNNPEQIRKTFETRYRKQGKSHFNETYDWLCSKEEFEAAYLAHTMQELLEKFNVTASTLHRRAIEYGLREKRESSAEIELVNFLIQAGIPAEDIVQRNRTILGGQELDIYLPKQNYAIEYNGIFYHQETNCFGTTKPSRHQDKFRLAEEKGIQLFSIFSNEWATRQKQIMQKILMDLNLADVETVDARKCVVKEVESSVSKVFLEENHIQGYSSAKHRLGLFHKNKLVALMTFSKPRHSIGKKQNDTENTYELIRFAASARVRGGASKLLSYFVRTYSPTTIVSFSENSYTNGKLYQTLGFDLESESLGYFYVAPDAITKHHRVNFQKHKLVKLGYDPSKTASEIMRELGYFKVWDCGKKKWVLKSPKR